MARLKIINKNIKIFYFSILTNKESFVIILFEFKIIKKE